MNKTIAVAGKGGVGKTLISGLLARWLVDNGGGPVLAVDADANANLHEVLGMEPGQSVGAIREEMKELAGQVPAGMTKAQFLEYKIETALVEGDRLDLLVMGRPEGPGCYCYANNLLRDILGKLTGHYKFVVIDNEAGMEHLSRRLMQSVDLLLVISDPSLRGIDTACRLSRVPREVQTRVGRTVAVVNRVGPGGLRDEARQRLEAAGLELVATIPEDAAVARCDQTMGNLHTLYPDSDMAREVRLLGGLLGLGT